MHNFKKVLCAVFLVLALLVVSLTAKVSDASSTETTVQDKAISTLTNVIGLDMTKYKAELITDSKDYPDIYGGLAHEQLTYNVEFAGSNAQIGCSFVNETLTDCNMYPINGSLLYAQPLSANIITATKTLLQRYQAYSPAVNLRGVNNVLDTVSEVKTMNASAGNMQLRITEADGLVNFVWWQTINGADFPYGLSVEFVNGQLKGFSDYSSLYKIGSASVKISRETAIQITKDRAKSFATLQVPTENGAFKEVTLNFTDEHMVVELESANREPLTMYPLWYVRLYADKPYGGTDGFQAGIWADTGEIAYAQLTSYHGEIDDYSSSGQSSTQQPQNNSTDSSIVYLMLAVAVVAVAIGSAFAVSKIRRK